MYPIGVNVPPELRRTRTNTRGALVAAAERLFARRRSTNVSIDELCAEAGFTRGAYYSNFSSMDEVFFAVYEQHAEKLLDRLEGVQRPRDTEHAGEVDALAHVARNLVEAIPADVEWFTLRVGFADAAGTRGTGDTAASSALRDHNERFTDRLLPVLAHAVQQAGFRLLGDPLEATRIIIAAHVGAVLQGPLSADPAQLRYDTVLAALRGVTATYRPDPTAAHLYALDVARGAVVRVDPEGGAVTQVVTGGLASPDGLVVDGRERAVYVSLMGRPDGPPAGRGAEPDYMHTNGAVVRVSLDAGPVHGSDVEEIVPTGTFTTGKQLVTDPTTGMLYWCDREGRAVYRSRRDGSEVSLLVSTAGHGPTEDEERCVGVCVDPVNGYLYWTQKGPADGGRGRIFRAGLELPVGVSAEDRRDTELLWEGLPEPIDLELDGTGRTLYWTDRGTGPQGNSLTCAAVPGPGEKGGAPTVLATGFREAIGLALDEEARVAYVSDLSGSIRAVGLDGASDRTVTVLPGAATGIALARCSSQCLPVS